MQLWFYEAYGDELLAGFKARDVLFRGQSDFQRIDVIETYGAGRMLLLDGLVMVSTSDEFIYHELIAHVPSLHHPKPENVLVVGGGDGGTVRELLKHPDIKQISLCEIDGLVVEVCEKYFPELASGLRDPRVRLEIGDGVAFVRESVSASFDLVIVDSTDPSGPGEALFTGDFYKNVARLLRPGGLMVCQSDSPWQDTAVLKRIQRNVRAGFPFSHPYIASIPSYPHGLWSWTLGALHPLDLCAPDVKRLAALQQNYPLRYLNEDVLRGLFSLPNCFRQRMSV
jgi:spermidine synthase